MALPTRESKKRISMLFNIIFMVVLALVARIGYLQIVKGEELRKEVLDQWTRGITVEPERGKITDRNGVELAVSLKRDTIWAKVSDIPEHKIEGVVKALSETLDMDYDTLYKRFNGEQDIFRVKRWIERDQSDTLKSMNLSGLNIVEDNMRYYPYENFASYIIGHTNSDQDGQYGIERSMNTELKGVAGKIVRIADGVGGELPFDRDRIYEPQNGYDLELTIDSNIQKFAEQAIATTLELHSPKSASAIVMNPNTGDILAMASTPGYNLNNPRDVSMHYSEEEWAGLSTEDQQNVWYDMWRNYNVNDVYEPGSTFKTLVVGAAIEEGLIDENSTYFCDGYAKGLESSTPVRCWSYLKPHGQQTLAEGLKNSCNVVMVDIGLKLGKEKIYEYIKSFGFGSTTGLQLTGESAGIIPRSADSIEELTLANLSFGQGLAVTPLQLVTAVSSVANGGDLMQANIIKKMIDDKGNEISKSEPKVVRKVMSEDVASRVLSMMEFTYNESYDGKIEVPGYRVGAKTGTSQKIVDGAYSREKHIGSFVGIAPISSPEIIVLTVVDESTSGSYFGTETAAPMAEEILNKTLNYLGVEKDNIDKEEKIEVPNLVGIKVQDAIDMVDGLGLDYTTDSYYIDPEAVVLDQEPDSGEEVSLGSFVKIYLEGVRERPEEEE